MGLSQIIFLKKGWSIVIHPLYLYKNDLLKIIESYFLHMQSVHVTTPYWINAKRKSLTRATSHPLKFSSFISPPEMSKHRLSRRHHHMSLVPLGLLAFPALPVTDEDSVASHALCFLSSKAATRSKSTTSSHRITSSNATAE